MLNYSQASKLVTTKNNKTNFFKQDFFLLAMQKSEDFCLIKFTMKIEKEI